MSAPAVSAPSPTGRQTVLVAVGQGSVMLFGGVLALLIAQLFGKTTDTDAFFAAYGFYAVGLTFGGTFRLTAVPPLVRDRDGATATRMLGAVGLMAAALLVPMVLLAGPLGSVLVPDDPGAVAPTALRILWVALGAQLLFALLATMLAVRGHFAALAVALLFAGLVSLPVFLATEGAAGVQAAALAVAAGGLWQILVSVVALRRDGWRLHRVAATARASLAAVSRQAAYLVHASAPFIGTTLAYVVCIAVASRQGPGDLTLFAYAYVLGGILLGLTANVAAQVRSPAVVARADRTAEAAVVSLWTFRFTLLLCGPPLALAWLAGAPLLGVALGGDFSDDDVVAILLTLACLTGYVLASAASIFAIVELIARGALRRLTVIAVAQVVVLVPLAIVGARAGGIAGIAVALSAVQVVVAWAQMRSAFGAELGPLAAALARALARELAVIAAALAPALAVLLLVGGVAGEVLAAAVGAALAAAATWRAWPAESRSLLAVVRR